MQNNNRYIQICSNIKSFIDMIIHIYNDIFILDKKKEIPSDNHGRKFFEIV